MGLILIIVLIVLLAGAGMPHWGYWGPGGSPYGWYPASGLGLIVLILVILLLLGRI